LRIGEIDIVHKVLGWFIWIEWGFWYGMVVNAKPCVLVVKFGYKAWFWSILAIMLC